MSDKNDNPVDGTEVDASVASQDATHAQDVVNAGAQEEVVEDKSVTITMSKRAARIGAFLLAGFLGFVLGVIGTRVAHHLHDGPGGHQGRWSEHMRMHDGGHMGPGQGMMNGGPGGYGMPGGPDFGPDDQRGPGMMPGYGPQESGVPTPAPTTN